VFPATHRNACVEHGCAAYDAVQLASALAWRQSVGTKTVLALSSVALGHSAKGWSATTRVSSFVRMFRRL